MRASSSWGPSCLVYAWLLEQGRQFCFLYTDPANPTSNRIYQQIGYEPVCDWVQYAFELAISQH